MRKTINFFPIKKFKYLLVAMLLLPNCTIVSAAAISVPESVQNTATSLRNKANEIKYKRNNTIYLERIKQWLEDNKMYYQKALADQKNLIEELSLAQKNFQTAQSQTAENQQKSSEASSYLLQAGYSLADTAKVIKQIESEISRLDKELKDLQLAQTTLISQTTTVATERNFEAEIKNFNTLLEQQKIQLAAQILSEVGYDENNLAEAEIKLEKAVLAATAPDKIKLEESIAKEKAKIEVQKQAHTKQVVANYSLMDTVSAQIVQLYKHQEAAYVVHSHTENLGYITVMENYVSSLNNDLSTIQSNIVKLQKEADKLQLDLQNVQKQFEPITTANYGNTQTKFYTWQNEQGNSGQQLYQPLGYYTLQNSTEVGIYSGYINSRIKNAGSFAGITDTSLYIGQISRKNPYTITYMMDFRLPTGKSQIPKDSIVSDDLVEYSHLGEGFNWAPGLRLNKQVGEEDMWSAQINYNIRGNYDYIPGTHISPSNEFIKNFSWQHAGQTWQFYGTIAHTNYTRAQENNIRYSNGDKYDLQATYNRVLTAVDDLMFYYWFSLESKNKYYTPLTWSPGGNLSRHYIGTQWLRKLSSKSQINLMFNTMFSRGDSYDPITEQRVTKRNKYTLRLGYSLQLSSTAQLSFQIERFYMYDGNENSKYRGNNYYFIYSKKL